MSQLGIRYRTSPLSLNGPNAPRHGPKAGDRLPDAPILHDGQTVSLHDATARPGWHLLLCGPTGIWPGQELTDISRQYADLITVHRLSATDAPGVLRDSGGRALRRLGLAPGDTALYLVRPDGHVGYRSGEHNLAGLSRYLRRWLPAPTSKPAA